MKQGLIFFCCACGILLFTVINLSIAPITSGKIGSNWGVSNCPARKDAYDVAKDDPNKSKDYVKYHEKWDLNECTRRKGMHDMEYTAFIFDIVIGFVCGLLGLLHLFELKKDFAEKTGLIGLICGCIGFILTFIYVIFNGLVYTTYGRENINTYKRDGKGAIAKRVAEKKYECLYYDKPENPHSFYATYSDLIKKQYNYEKDYLKDVAEDCKVNTIVCSGEFYEPFSKVYEDADGNKECEKIYYSTPEVGIDNKDISDRFLTALILSLLICLASIGLAIFGFLIAKSGDF